MYLDGAKPLEGRIIVETGYDLGESHINEQSIAEWMLSTFGGDITLQAESTIEGEKRADYCWLGKQWELKNTTTAKSADSAIRKALKQISQNPGGIILDYGDNEVSLDEILSVVQSRIQMSGSYEVDVMIKTNSGLQIIWRFKK